MSGRRRSPIAPLLPIILLAAACGGPSPERIVLVSTNDVHGALESVRREEGTGRPVGGHAAFATYVEEIRRETGGRLVLLDAGDIFQGTALSNLLEGRPMTAVMNRIGYDAAVIGNHEFDWGVRVLRERIDEARFPFLGANVRERESGKRPSWLRPYAIVRRGGIRIAVIGLITEETPLVTLPSNVADLEFLPPAPEAQEWIDRLLPDSAEAAVLLVHIGGSEYGDHGARGPIVELAKAVRGEAAVLGGHTHGVFALPVEGVPVAMAGSRLHRFSRIDLEFDGTSRELLRAEARVVPVYADSGRADEEIAEMIARFRREVEPLLERVLGRAPADIGVAREECPMGNLLCDGIREGLDLDVALHNPGGVRASIPRGEISYAVVYEVMPFDNTVVILPMTGAEIEAALLQAASTVTFLHASGLSYVVDFRGDGPKVRDLRDGDGRPVEGDRTYRVGVNSFMAEGGDGLTLFREVPGAMETGILCRDLLNRQIEGKTAAGEEVTAAVEGRVTILR